MIETLAVDQSQVGQYVAGCPAFEEGGAARSAVRHRSASQGQLKRGQVMIGAPKHKNIAIREGVTIYPPLANKLRDATGNAFGFGLLIVVSSHDHRSAIWQGRSELFLKTRGGFVMADQVVRGLQNLWR